MRQFYLAKDFRGKQNACCHDYRYLLSSTDNFVGAAFFKREFNFLYTEDNGKVEATRSYTGILMFTVNTAVQEVLANVKSLIPILGREVIEGLQSSVVKMENKICSMGMMRQRKAIIREHVSLSP